MKNYLYILYALFFVSFLASCSQSSKECRIHGVMQDKSRDGKTIYLVPMENATKDNVDSTIIKDGKFEFVTQKNIMAIVRVELKCRYGLQDLLVVTEPGDLNVKIGAESSAEGTHQNDILQEWKQRTEEHTKEYIQARNSIKSILLTGDSTLAEKVKSQADSANVAYKNYSRELADKIGSGPLYDFLDKRFPKDNKK
ncbi:MAG: DUF4369 domain-containing protein [Prevotellaceae bacterium]|nr:DUF4369 domain-containing protein [Prevotellaceae bacterium]